MTSVDSDVGFGVNVGGYVGVDIIVGPNILPGTQEVRMMISTSNNQMNFLCMD